MTDSNYPNYSEPFKPQIDNESIDVKRYLSLFVSNWYWFLFSLFISIGIAYGINRYSAKVYTVSSTLLIKDDKIGGGLPYAENFLSSSNIFKSQQNLRNEVGILKSFSLNKRVIDSLPEFRILYYEIGRRNIIEGRLYKKCPFQVIPEAINDQLQDVKVYITISSNTTFSLKFDDELEVKKDLKFGEKLNFNGFSFVIKLRDSEHFKYNPEISNKFYFYFAPAEEIANLYRGKLSINTIDKDATLVNLSSSGYVAEQEIDYLNKLMELYLSQGLESKNQIADSTFKFIDRQLKTISDSLIKAEDKLQNFRLENKVIDLSKEGVIIQTRLEQFENEKTSLSLQQQYYQYLKEYLDSKNESGDIVSPTFMGVNDQTLVKLVEDLANQQQKKKQLFMNLSNEQPPVNLLEENIVVIRKALYENIKSSILHLDYLVNNVNKKIDQVNLDIEKLPVTERKMIKIQRQFDVNNTVYTYLLEKRAETGIAKASNVSDNKIIDKADIYNSFQIKPTPLSNDLKALFVGLLIPGLIITLLYFFNNKIIDNSDITKGTNVPIIGYISHHDNIKEIPVIDNPRSSLSESFRSVRTTLRYFIKETNHPVVAITSTISSEGKTFISINLAAVIALLGKKVLLIGLDLRKPRIHKVLGIKNDVGLSSYLSNNCEYEEVIRETSINNLYYAVSGPVPPNPAELIETERMNTFIEKAKREFDYIIIDTPPLAVVSDTLLLARFVDINLFVVRQRYSSKNTLDLIQELYVAGKLKNMSIIINDISLTGYYGYGLRYGYYKGYGYSYGKNYYGKYSYSRYGYSDKEHGYYNS